MEAVAISVAKSALNLVVKTAATGITDEIGLLLGVQEELIFIKQEFEMMQVLLRAASRENVNGDVTDTWIQQVKELAMDLEDCLQEASVQLKGKSCLLAMCSVKERGHIARKIRELKARTIDVIKRKQRYNHIGKENGGPTYDENVLTRLNANVDTFLAGLDVPKRTLVGLILKENGEVISVVGMGGLGKTTLAREVYHCNQLQDYFDRFAWVTILHPFNMVEFIEILAKQIPANPDDIKSELFPKKTIKEMVTEYLKDKKYLIVLDDLCLVSEWAKINDVLPKGNERRIIVTTRLRPLAESISRPSDIIFQFTGLTEDHALDLFYKTVYKTHNYHVIDDRESKDELPYVVNYNMKYGPSSTEIMEEESEVQKIITTKDMSTQANLIINSCSRLPLAIVIVGSYLATRPKTSAQWERITDHLCSEFANNMDLGVVKNVFNCSYDGMPYHLKPCLLYLSVFHNHKEIRRSRIIRQWMADEVIRGHKKKVEQIGISYFYGLMGMSLIQPSKMRTIVNGDVKRCNIHDMMYELILAKAMDENIVSLVEDENLITMTEKVRHLVITGGACERNRILARMKLSHMRSLSIFGEVGDYLRYPRMNLVRVLDLEDTLNLNNRDLRGVGKLRHLKYLGLRGTKITKLPNSLGKLSELETLDIRNTAIVRLPTRLTMLHKLSYLRAGFDLYSNQNIKQCIEHYGSVGVTTPRGIGELWYSLNNLGMIDIGRGKGLVKEMQKLTNLIKLAVTGFSKENGIALAKVIDSLKHLRSLVLSAADDSGLRCCLDSVSSPPRYLQSLKLYSPLGELPDWISSLENLEKIHLRNTLLTEEIEAIGRLPNLMFLYMTYNSFKIDVKELCFGEGKYRMLQVMILEGLKELESVSIKKTALKRLEQLKIRKCWNIGKMPGFEFLEQLKEMEVVVYSDKETNQMLVSNLEERLSMHPNKPILRVTNK